MGAGMSCRTAPLIGSVIEAVDDKVRCHKDADFFGTLRAWRRLRTRPSRNEEWAHVYCTMSMKPVVDVVEPLTALTVTL
jgi:hypothetical protein